jgi:hypothetical protein
LADVRVARQADPFQSATHAIEESAHGRGVHDVRSSGDSAEKRSAGNWEVLAMRDEEIRMKKSRVSANQILDMLKHG